ncbi:hypothetical protein LY76DRAFT_263022 [Colletotrichum caudatum]|nr:hypothetical protein LY76DRAFT_263022 [Colletotrichum caudatum]
MDKTPTRSIPPSLCPPAPVTTRQTTALSETPLSRSLQKDQYCLFLAGLGSIDRTSQLPKLSAEVNASLSQFNPETATNIRRAYVADTTKFRMTREVVERGLSTPDKRCLRNMVKADSRRRCTEKLSQYHAELDSLCGGRRSWLPQGVEVDALSYDTVLDLRKIITWSIQHGERPDSLWEPSGHLHHVPYKKKPLDAVWKRLSRQPGGANPDCSSISNENHHQQNRDLKPCQRSARDEEEENGSDGDHWNPGCVDLSLDHDSDVDSEEEAVEQARRARRARSDSSSVSMELDDSFRFSRVKSSPPESIRRPGDNSLFIPHSLSIVEEQSTLAPVEPQENNLLPEEDQSIDGKEPLTADTPPPLTPPRSFETPPSLSSLPCDPLPAAVTISRGSSVGLKRQRSTSGKAGLAFEPFGTAMEPAPENSNKKLNCPKRPRVAISPERFDLRARHGFDAQCLADGRNVEGTVIAEILDTVCALCPLSMMLLDPLVSHNNIIPQRLRDEFLAQKDMTILYPINLTSRAKHWVLVSASATSVSIFDSLPSATDQDELTDLLRPVLSLVGEAPPAPGNQPPAPTRVVCPQQPNATDCGVAVIVNALYVIAGQDIPAKTDYSVWRRVLLTFCTGGNAVAGILPEDSAQRVSVSTHDMPLPPAPPTTMTEAGFASWDEKNREYRQKVMDHARAQLNARRTRHERMMKTLEDVVVVFGALRRSGSSSTTGMDQIQEELANCHSALQSLARLRRTENSMMADLEARCARLADAQRRRTGILMELARVTDAIPDREVLDHDLAALRPWDALGT